MLLNYYTEVQLFAFSVISPFSFTLSPLDRGRPKKKLQSLAGNGALRLRLIVNLLALIRGNRKHKLANRKLLLLFWGLIVNFICHGYL